jgi:hypothetical protein
MSTQYFKELRFFDRSLMSGSSDLFRTQMGAGLVVRTDPDGVHGTYVTPLSNTYTGEAIRALSNVGTGRGWLDDLASAAEDLDDAINETEGLVYPLDPDRKINPNIVGATSARTVGGAWAANNSFYRGSSLPILKYPCRIYGSKEQIDNDTHWAKFVYGGVYGDNEYKGLFKSQQFFNHWFTYPISYTTREIRNEVELSKRRPDPAVLGRRAMERKKEEDKQFDMLRKREMAFSDDGSFASSVESPAQFSEINISYEYNRYMRKYENYTSKLPNERLIPSLYLLQATSEVDSFGVTRRDYRVDNWTHVVDGNFNKYLERDDINFVSRENKVENWTQLLKDEFEREVDKIYKAKGPEGLVTLHQMQSQRRKRVFNYLDHSLRNHRISEKTTRNISLKSRNVLFDKEAITGVMKNAAQNRELFPYYAKISFKKFSTQQRHAPSKMAAPLQNNFWSRTIDNCEFSPKFLVSLKDVFGQKPGDLKPEKTNFLSQTTNTARRKNRGYVSQRNLRCVDMGKLFNKARNDYISPMSDFCFIGRKDIPSRQTAKDKSGKYRYYNTQYATWVLHSYLTFINWEDYLKDLAYTHDFRNELGHANETIAYRVEKIGGPPTGDSKTRNVIQNFWFSNSIDAPAKKMKEDKGKKNTVDASSSGNADLEPADEFNFYDTQVKYGKEYTYRVYAYVVVCGARYTVGDQRITRTIAIDDGSTDPSDESTSKKNVKKESAEKDKGDNEIKYCLEFYDPTTGQTKEALYYQKNKYEEIMNPENDFITTSQIFSKNKYLVDFLVTAAPSVKIYEIPLATKKIKVLDSPPNQAQALPFEVADETNRIGFDIEYTPTMFAQFPPMISRADRKYRDSYMGSNDLLKGTKIQKESLAFPRYLEVYRTETPPRSYADFNGKLRKRIDLKIKDSIYTLKEHIYYDIVNTNKEYYYTFRFVSEHNCPGRPSLVHKAELRDDGGYKYPIFDLFDFDEYKAEKKSENTTTSFKKLISIGPNLQHMAFVEDSFNTRQTSAEALRTLKVGLGASKPSIWNKRFKFRLTSKKTGKKIDLNITYNLRRE